MLTGTAVAVANVDAHVSLPPVGLTEQGKMLMIMGTSTCDIMLSDEEKMSARHVRRGRGRRNPGTYGL